MKKILITGSSGFLGCRLVYYLRDRYELLLPSHGEMNVSHEETVKAYIEEHRPEIVIHCAALSNTWYCEQHSEESHRVNVQGTVRIVKACKLTGAKLIFMSSDQVYNGTTLPGPLDESVAIQPVNIYGQHKLEAEQRALRNYPDAVGLRLTWMYDLPSSSMKLNSNILVNLNTAFCNGNTLKAATHEYRGVTNVWDVVRNIEKTFNLPGGIYNYGSCNRQNSYVLHIETAKAMGLKKPSSWIQPDEDRFAVQERNLTMDCSKIGQYGIQFYDSIEGIANAIMRPFRTE